MGNKNLLNTNPYLADPKLRAKMIHASVVTSTAIEGVHIKPAKQAVRKKIPTSRKL